MTGKKISKKKTAKKTDSKKSVTKKTVSKKSVASNSSMKPDTVRKRRINWLAVIVLAFLFGGIPVFVFYPSEPDPLTQEEVLETQIQSLKEDLAAAQKEQGQFRTWFWDTEKVDTIQATLEAKERKLEDLKGEFDWVYLLGLFLLFFPPLALIASLFETTVTDTGYRIGGSSVTHESKGGSFGEVLAFFLTIGLIMMAFGFNIVFPSV